MKDYSGYGISYQRIFRFSKVKQNQVPLRPGLVFPGGVCCKTFVPPYNMCKRPCWSKSNTSLGSNSSTGSYKTKTFREKYFYLFSDQINLRF